MTYGVTTTGFARPTLNDIIESRTTLFRAVHGQDTYLDPDGPDGQQLAIEAEAESDLWQVAEDVYNSFGPYASGAALSQLALLAGLTKLLGSNAQVTLSIYLRVGAPEVPVGAIVQDVVTGVKYTTTVGSGTSVSETTPLSVSAQAIDKGTVKSLAGDITKIVTPVYGWLSVTNAGDSTAGVAAESEEAFRLRRTASVANPSQGITDGLRGAIAALQGVGKTRVLENDTGEWGAVNGVANILPPHSIAVLVEQVYSVSDIVYTIWLRKSQGVTLFGSSTNSVADSVGDPHVINWTVATPRDIDVSITYEEIAGEGFGGVEGEAAVKAALSAWVHDNIPIGGLVIWSYLFSPALGAVVGRSGGAAIRIHTLEVCFHGESPDTNDFAVEWDEIARLNEANITMSAEPQT